jgi:hypothetical protein
MQAVPRLLLCAFLVTLVACGQPDPVELETPPGETELPPAPPAPTGPPPPLPPDDAVDYVQVRAMAPIDAAEIRSTPQRTEVWLQSGLPGGCARFDGIEVERDRYEFEIRVWNLMPHPDAQVACTKIYGMREHTVELEGPFEVGETYSVYINRDTALDFTAQ